MQIGNLHLYILIMNSNRRVIKSDKTKFQGSCVKTKDGDILNIGEIGKSMHTRGILMIIIVVIKDSYLAIAYLLET